MVVIGAILFLLGTIDAFTMANPLKAAEIIIEKTQPTFSDKLTNYGLPGYPPFISNFMEHGTNVFFKPHFTVSPVFANGHEVIFGKDCNKRPIAPVPFGSIPEFIIDEPVKIIETTASGAETPSVDKVVVIKPESPIQPEISVPQMIISPLPAVAEELVEVPVSSPIVHPDLPPFPIIPGPINDAFQSAIIEEVKPVFIPDAPELPPLSVPEVPSLPTVPVLESVSITESHENIIHIPEAPELPPYLPPKLPLPVVMSEVLIKCDKHNKTQQFNEAPVLIESQPSMIENLEPMIIPLPPVLPPTEILVSQSVLEEKPVDILPAPVIPEFLPVSETVMSNQDHVKPILPMTLPNPIELSPMTVPDLPVSNFIPEPIYTAPELPLFVESKPMLIEHNKFNMMEIPAPPVLPPMAPVSLPITAEVSELIVDSPKLPYMDEPKPVLINDSKFESMEILPAPFLPPVAPVSSVITEPVAVAPELVSNEVTVVEVPEYVKPVPIPEASLSTLAVDKEIPVAPELPPLHFPSMPILMEQPMPALYSSAELTPLIIEEPKLPVQYNKPLYMTFAEPAKLPISKVESIISFPTSCVQNIVLERVLPNIVREKKVDVFSSSNYPVLSSYLPNIGMTLF